ncbi:hypothetical protein DYBT9623_00166 [Dyadobacter sp. CECT 9623]|uniref:DUF4010 domain-containing protein n=1 Tax=Dyadobacter linearis TaxID=2823330 RepID=A0ABM8UJ37_9BACT|nr:DUF4010 domain-containing protein [Dyadobacter sp. CECT 9623]CAG5067445.1 hypothetical protein DYBT9623_00166 [Dyadobacter sp. CECT 9623]
MTDNFAYFEALPTAIKIGVCIAIGMLMGMEREWANKDAGTRTFAVVALLGMLASMISQYFIIAALGGVLLLILLSNVQSLMRGTGAEVTTSAVLILDFTLGVLVGRGYVFAPVAAAVVTTMLLAWKSELNRFAGGLSPAEIRSAIWLGLFAFVIYPIIPDRYIDRTNLFNPHDAWSSIIAISAISFVNYLLLRVLKDKGLYIGAFLGGFVNSTATIAELSGKLAQSSGRGKVLSLCLLTTIAMLIRNLIILGIFSPESVVTALFPVALMCVAALCWIRVNWISEQKNGSAQADLTLSSPISLKQTLTFGLLFVFIQIGSNLLGRIFGDYGLLATGALGGLVSSASTTASAASIVVNFPIIWRGLGSGQTFVRVCYQLGSVLAMGMLALVAFRFINFSLL